MRGTNRGIEELEQARGFDVIRQGRRSVRRALTLSFLPPFPSVAPFPAASSTPALTRIGSGICVGIPPDALLLNLAEGVRIAQRAGILEIELHNLPILEFIPFRRPVVHRWTRVRPQFRTSRERPRRVPIFRLVLSLMRLRRSCRGRGLRKLAHRRRNRSAR